MPIFVIIAFILITITFPLSGCKKKAGQPPRPEKKVEVKEEIEFKPVITSQERDNKNKGYIYNPVGRRDPFAPLVVLKKKKAREEAKRPPGTLESYDIGDFSLLAIVQKGPRHYALLLAPDNRSFTVGEGDTIGLNNGKIKKITSNRVIMVEYIVDYKGDRKPREIVLELHKED